MRRKEWSRFAAFAAAGVLLGFVVDRYVVGFHLEPAERVVVAPTVTPVEATRTPTGVDDETEPIAVVPPVSASVSPSAVPLQRREGKPTAARRTPMTSSASSIARTGLVIDLSK